MDFQKLVYRTCLNILAFTFVAFMFGVLMLPEDVFYLLGIFILIGVLISMHENLLTFLTVKKVFLTRLLSIALIVFGLLIFFEYTIPGFYVNTYTLNPKSFTIITVENYTLPKYATIGVVSFFIGLVSASMLWLQKGGSSE